MFHGCLVKLSGRDQHHMQLQNREILMEIISRKNALLRGETTYYTGVPCIHNHISRRFTASERCVTCAKIARRKDRHNARYPIPKRNIAWTLFTAARSRSLRLGIEFNILAEDVVVPPNCPCCYRKMVGGAGKKYRDWASPTLDRTDPRKGYITGNVAVICWGCNRLKNNATVTDLVRLTNYVLRALGKSRDAREGTIPLPFPISWSD